MGKNYKVPSFGSERRVFDTTLVNKKFNALSAEQFYKNLNRLMVNNPPYEADSAVLNEIEKIRVKAGVEFSLTQITLPVAKSIQEGYAEGYTP